MYTQQAPGFSSYQAACGGRSRRWGRHVGHGPAGGPPWARFFSNGWPQPVPVNIETTDSSFVLCLYAAGLTKENFSVALQDDILTISYKGTEAEDAGEAPDPRYTRREFRNPSFERAFLLNGKVLADGITAQYADGILTVTLPKNPVAYRPAQAVYVA